MTNPIFEHLPPGPQRDEAEVEARMSTARATIARLDRDLDEARRKLVDASCARRHEQIETYARIAKLERRVAAERRSRRGLREGKKSAERINADAILRLHSLADSISEHAYQELASALEAPPRQDRPLGDQVRAAPDDEEVAFVAHGDAARMSAALFGRIAKADAKHPRDLPDGEENLSVSVERLNAARRKLASQPTWRNAFVCEVREALVELAKGDLLRLCEELEDVSTLSTRWKRAIGERGATT